MTNHIHEVLRRARVLVRVHDLEGDAAVEDAGLHRGPKRNLAYYFTPFSVRLNTRPRGAP